MKGMRGVQQARDDALRSQLRQPGFDLRRGPSHDTGERAVLGGERQAGWQTFQQLGRGQPDRQHAAARHGLHQRAADGDEPRRISERHHAGQHGGGELTNAVADQCGRPRATRQPGPSQRVFEAEGGGLHGGGGGQVIFDAWGGVEAARTQVERQRRLQRGHALVERRSKRRVMVIQALAHAGVLRALTGEQPDQRWHGSTQRTGGAVRVVGRAQCSHGLGRRFGHHAQPVREAAAAHLQGVRHIGEVEHRLRLKVVGQLRRHAVQRGRGTRRQLQQLRPVRRARWRRERRLFHHHMRVRSADAEAADASPARLGRARPGREAVVDHERAGGEIDRGVRAVEVNARRQLFGGQ